ncbi:DNA gyrase inhibitor YacG, partial [Klebsiella pneumoniae]
CERCKLIDLGAWAAEEHAIPGNDLEDEMFSGDLPTRPH